MNEMIETKTEVLSWLAGFGEYAPLLRILLALARSLEITVTACHVNHRLPCCGFCWPLF